MLFVPEPNQIISPQHWNDIGEKTEAKETQHCSIYSGDWVRAAQTLQDVKTPHRASLKLFLVQTQTQLQCSDLPKQPTGKTDQS